jgi:hypothetical protein
MCIQHRHSFIIDGREAGKGPGKRIRLRLLRGHLRLTVMIRQFLFSLLVVVSAWQLFRYAK